MLAERRTLCKMRSFNMNKTKKQSISKQQQLPSPDAFYDENFQADNAYKLTMPDVQNADKHAIKGANVPIMQVGIGIPQAREI